MSEITVSKAINPSQLCYELNGARLNITGPREDGTTLVSSDVAQSVLDSTINAHTANPAWVNPTPVPINPSIAIKASGITHALSLGFTQAQAEVMFQ